ncbi:MAG: selenium metabolism-associated LysR family transcriptional regulator [Bacillota bacterium]|nr:selenium metabolism-associated LysR family transcriptional regulator [Bacillota bacterium]
MDFHQLEAFAYTVENKSFSAAAEKLYLTQPTISAHIRSLEKELKVRLIKRTTKEFEITADGQRLYEYAVNILHLRNKAVHELSDDYKKELFLGVSSVPGQCVLPGILSDYHHKAPELHFHIYQSDSMEIIQKVKDGNIDVGIVGTTAESDCVFEPFVLDELVIAAPNTAHYQRMLQAGCSFDELLKEPFIMRTGSSGTKLETERFLSGLNISIDKLNIIVYLNDADALRQCIIQGIGISIISRRMVEQLEQQGLLMIFPLGKYKLIRNLYIVYMENRYLPKNTSDFILFLKEYPKREML